ncbi:NADH:flavin oxidoreductase/NADH oxidase [Flavobacterium sp. Fl-77]|uniref:NADH:flavin oxidoreductase/NADH oxidase n=1 Tax=Flavobacterium flavipigmentatum TaxID=2893884 RepID=A0AAJ2SA81_9FLAO|nr:MULTISPECIES: NADH:flavin oxidoreductase/NADH oxidase [unclassified Flavobacterium]MDX6181090.1 NADH:flavin oxidoreductase/NADH oxidase [Flavobacterium sp. Fl-33]MDX6184691.1 NADH:flavin oxidoreductase/NADH oxidase [Flavobacterium sp. Fl-77]UFH39792.1 NADH:flavin oxidoreductase/NADH oxidase [Flavobacterium sp. F-70]
MASLLFSPLSIKKITLKNRIAISPMCQYSALDGFANNWHLVHLGSRASGGAGLIIQEATAVSPEARISPADLGIWKDGHIEKLRTINEFIVSQNAIPGIQLAHAGRKASVSVPWEGNKKLDFAQGGWQTVAPSAIPYHDDEPFLPEALDKSGIQKVIADFKAATKRAVLAGYQVMEIHGAHGYLLHQFLSPFTNKRTDEYGGSFENRIRFTLEILAAVQTEWPSDLPLMVRISATDWAEGGWNPEESVQLSKILKEKGVDLIDVSSGGLVSHQQIDLGPNYQVPFAEKVKKEANILTGAVGLITEAKQAEAILENGQADLVLFARESLRNPNLPLDFAKELNDDIQWPKQYERAKN